MTDGKVRDYVATGVLGLAAIAGILAAGSLFSPRTEPTKGSDPKPEPPRRTPAKRPIVIAPGCGVIEGRDLHRVQRALRSLQGPIDIIIDVYGGYVSAVDPMVHAFLSYRARGGKITAYVPYKAFSGGTMAALAANEIVMGETAVLGPVDPQIGGVAASDLRALMESKNPDRIGDTFHVLNSMGRKSEQETIALVRSLVRTEEAVAALTSGVTTHSHGITLARAKALGLPVRTGVPREYFDVIDRRLNRPQLLWDL